jgi:hypothetical protein
MPRSHDVSSRPDRRSVVLSGAALVGAAAVPIGFPLAVGAGLAPAAEFLARTNQFLSSLEPEQRKAASFAWNGPEWRGWNYFGSSDFIKPGLRLEQMTALQKAAAWELLATILSPSGLEKSKNVMTLQDVLASLGNGAGKRSSERFSFAVFGAPAEIGAWGFRFEGHHLSQSFAVRDGRIIAVTPSSFSALPNRVASGKHAGLVTLKGEEALARKLYGDLAPKLQTKARLSDTPLGNILSYSGRERANAQKAGLPAADLASGQRHLLWQLIDTYTVEHVSPDLATAQKARVTSGDREAVHFAWYGPNTAEKAFGYRVIGDSFVIELGSVDAAAQHLHTIYHDLDSVLGRAA